MVRQCVDMAGCDYTSTVNGSLFKHIDNADMFICYYSESTSIDACLCTGVLKAFQ